jgi:hypothetical protein
MIQLHPDYLIFETDKGQMIPCSAELVAVELIGEAGSCLDPDLVQQAASAVLHYFKQDLGCQTVSVGEFSRALEQALETLGVGLSAAAASQPGAALRSYDLTQLAAAVDRGFELSFFARLRDEMRTRLGQAPTVVRFHGLRGCVKQLTGAKRWTQRCQTLNDQIVEYLRACLRSEAESRSCDLDIR